MGQAARSPAIRGAEWGPEEMDYGLIEFAVKDPNGYLLSFGQPVV
jgi:hypothetical protein